MQNDQSDGTIIVAQVALMQTALISLFATHPDKAALCAKFEAHSNEILDSMLHTGVSDLAIESTQASQKAFLAVLTE